MTVTAWGPGGKGVFKIVGDCHPNMLFDGGCSNMPVRVRERRPWTPEEDKYLKDNYAYGNAQNIANHLKRTRNAVFGRANRFGLCKPQSPALREKTNRQA